MTNQTPIVWVVQEGNNDYSSAEEHGEVRFITKGVDLRNTVGCDQNKEVERQIDQFKSSYLQGTDYIILVGNPMLSALVTMNLREGRHMFLKWDGRRMKYIQFTLDTKLQRN